MSLTHAQIEPLIPLVCKAFHIASDVWLFATASSLKKGKRILISLKKKNVIYTWCSHDVHTAPLSNGCGLPQFHCNASQADVQRPCRPPKETPIAENRSVELTSATARCVSQLALFPRSRGGSGRPWRAERRAPASPPLIDYKRQNASACKSPLCIFPPLITVLFNRDKETIKVTRIPLLEKYVPLIARQFIKDLGKLHWTGDTVPSQEGEVRYSTERQR